MSRALLKYIRLSPTKARLVARQVQGMNAEIAIASLEFTPNKAARVISKVIASAVANGGYDAQDVVILSCRVDAGPVLRRFMPRAKGRATPIRKPTAHILVEVGTSKGAKKSVEAPKQKDSGKRIEAKESTKVKTATKPKAEVKTESKAKTTAKKTEDAKKVSTKKTEGEEK
ncbi:50S ribosomal protein L22 [Helicobacter typhlonius]|uniref:50S ribosomal protein L22 n=1 Tax=Helicobacter typhlonius TaxID=76936 RepID=UPI002FE323E6